ncbi:unnamed protein product [Closterium sp. NIES-54]
MTHQVARCRPAPHALPHGSLSSSTAVANVRSLKAPTPALLLTSRRSSCRLAVRAILDKSSSRNSNSRSGSGDPGDGHGKVSSDPLEVARSALERLFQQAHEHEEKQRLLGPATATDLTGASVAFLEDAVQQLEVDLAAVFEALREKEGELALDERRVADERASLVTAREALMAREAQLEERQAAQGVMRDEAERLRRKVREQDAEVEEVKRAVAEREAELTRAKEVLALKEEEIARAHLAIRQRNERIEAAEMDAKTRETQLSAAEAELRRLEADVAAAEGEGRRAAQEAEAARRELERQEAKLQKMAAELEGRAQVVAAAEEEINALSARLREAGASGKLVEQEVSGARRVVGDLKAEMALSGGAAEAFRAQVKELRLAVARKGREASSARMQAQKRDKELNRAKGELERDRAALKAAKARVSELEKQVRAQVDEAERLRSSVNAERAEMLNASTELAQLRKEFRRVDGELREAKLLRDAQAKLATSQADLATRTADLMAAQRSMVEMRREMKAVAMELRVKEERLAGMAADMARKDARLAQVEQQLDGSNARLVVAESTVQQIAQLSQKLADSALEAAERLGLGPSVSLDAAPLSAGAAKGRQYLNAHGGVGESALLAETNQQLFAASRALLERDAALHRLQVSTREGREAEVRLRGELAVAQEELREREGEVVEVRAVLQERDEEVRRLRARWGQREGELSAIREEVVAGAREIGELKRAITGASRAGEGEGEGVQLADEVVKLELEGLLDLSYQLRDDCATHALPATHPRQPAVPPAAADMLARAGAHAAVGSGAPRGAKGEVKEEAGVVQWRVVQREEALGLAARAMGGLKRLTRKLVADAESELAGVMGGNAA